MGFHGHPTDWNPRGSDASRLGAPVIGLARVPQPFLRLAHVMRQGSFLTLGRLVVGYARMWDPHDMHFYVYVCVYIYIHIDVDNLYWITQLSNYGGLESINPKLALIPC